MAFNLVAQDEVVTIADRGLWTGTNATNSNTTSMTSFATLIESDPTMSTYNKPALGDTTERHRPNLLGGQIRVTLNILSSGPILGMDPATNLGKVVTIVRTPKTGLTTVTYTGLLIGDSHRDSAGQEQEQTLLLQLGLDGSIS